ncbi:MULTISPECIES: hypothetical protein [unclassified Mycolicibacterium]|uniref:hypothetical protein n=1 Tax=unclassified Mycolicibacterium TaxID=2636767 RepID=UPI00192E5F3B|nr:MULTISPECIES: hypothetical protein [unclassified Mycolicibacterium]
MRIISGRLAPLFAVGAGAVAIAVAPIAAAAPAATATPTCSSTGPGTECQTPGNVEINDSTPPDFNAQYPLFSLFGYGGNYAHEAGGGHGVGGGGHR